MLLPIWASELKNVPHQIKLHCVTSLHEDDIASLSPQQLREIGIPDNYADVILKQCSFDGAKRIEEDCERKEITLLSCLDSDYPELLRQIAEPPVLLYVRGMLPDYDHILGIGIVGSRKPTDSAKKNAFSVGYQLSRHGVSVISGCADGVDGAAMQGALKCDSPVTGVLGCGVDVVYPAANRSLFQMLEKNGCLLSEYAPGTPPNRWNFPRRNRLISALSQGVVVIEAGKKSGSLITASYATEQGKDVFAFPGAAGAEYCAGSNLLIKQGAFLAESCDDILAQYESRYELTPESLPEEAQDERQGSASTQERNAPLPAGRSNAENAVIAALAGGARGVDALSAETGLSVGAVMSSLTMLRISGIVLSMPGGMYRLNQ